MENTEINKIVKKYSCIFCNKNKIEKFNFPLIILKALTIKFQESKIIFFKRIINTLIDNMNNSIILNYRETLILEENAEYLRKLYIKSEINYRIQNYSDYFKFHKEKARLYMKPHAKILKNYYEKHKELNYYKFLRILNREKKEKNYIIETFKEDKRNMITNESFNNYNLYKKYYINNYFFFF